MILAEALLDWYDRHARSLPWRVSPDDRRQGIVADPYAVWLSEIMLQQTTVQAVKPYFEKFLSLWPTVAHMAAADEEDILRAWAGLGYYSRARNLHKCARMIAAECDGRFPETASELKSLPGIGDYTSAAIASIAFDEAVPVVDGNVERVITRLQRIATPLPKAKQEVKAFTADILSVARPGDYAQATMDLGATVCTPKRPACGVCPWMEPCQARHHGDQLLYPVKAPKKEKPTRYGHVFVILNDRNEVLLRKRPDKGLLASMMEVPGTEWREGELLPVAYADAPAGTSFRELPVPVRHTFTHFHLVLTVHVAEPVSPGNSVPEGRWIARAAVVDEALPNVFRKVLAAAL
ncbi:A/G-specific adenine glycosylase [Coralliovum pocilloporae]|uniref:A/G-specific adenine glycosylase n=1 Tax=Coralliovum pocilloporae TaxID=3066369 RepID=UPI00330753DD